MNLAQSIYEFGKKVTCCICLSLLNTPVAVLPCTHAFCQRCISTHLETKAHCPLCKAPAVRRNIRISDEITKIVNLYRILHPSSDNVTNHLMLSQMPSLSQLQNHFNVTDDVSCLPLSEEVYSESILLPLNQQASQTQSQATPIPPPLPPVIDTSQYRQEVSQEPESMLIPIQVPPSLVSQPHPSPPSPSEPPQYVTPITQIRHEEKHIPSTTSFDIFATAYLGSDISDGEEYDINVKREMDEDICDICGGEESFLDDPILFCDGCNIPVHMQCYGLKSIPEGEWKCDRCLYGGNKKISCCLCPITKGTIKRTVNKNQWAHMSCAIWIPETVFTVDDCDIIGNLDKIDKRRLKALCCICQVKGQGACIQCASCGCKSWFHVTCALYGKSLMKIRADNSNKNGVKLEAYCPDCSLGDNKLCDSVGTTSNKKKGKRNRSMKIISNAASSSNAIAGSRRKVKRIKKGDVENTSPIISDDNIKVHNVVILLTGSFTEAQNTKARSLSSTLKGVEIVEEWSDRVTHIVTQTTHTGAPKRTFKLLYGLISGRWVLSFGWIMASLLKGNNSLADEAKFEISSKILYSLLFLHDEFHTIDYENMYIPKRERRLNRYLFEGYNFIFYKEDSWKSPPGPDISSLSLLITLGGGQINGNTGGLNIIITSSHEDFEICKKEKDVEVREFKWLLDSATGFSMIE